MWDTQPTGSHGGRPWSRPALLKACEEAGPSLRPRSFPPNLGLLCEEARLSLSCLQRGLGNIRQPFPKEKMQMVEPQSVFESCLCLL